MIGKWSRLILRPKESNFQISFPGIVEDPLDYPDNIQESILIFQKGRFDYSQIRELSPRLLEKSKIPLGEYNGDGWHLTVWNITNVLPLGDRLEKGVAAFPEEIPRRLIKLFSFPSETVLDPFLGSGTTMKVAQDLGRNSWGYEIDAGLKGMMRQKFAKRPSDARVEFTSSRENRISRSLLKTRKTSRASGPMEQRSSFS